MTAKYHEIKSYKVFSNLIMERQYYFNESINKDRENYFRYFAQKLFGDLFWVHVQSEQELSCHFLLAFHTLISNTCSLEKEDAMIIVYNSLIGDKLLFMLEVPDFKIYFEKEYTKFGKLSLIPFLNRKIKKNFQAFDDLYHMYETKMFNEGELKSGLVSFSYPDSELLEVKFEIPDI